MHVQVGFLLAGKGGIGQILGRCGGAHRPGDFFAVFFDQIGIGRLDRRIKGGRKGEGSDHAANLGAGLSQGIDVVHIELRQLLVDSSSQALLGHELLKSVSGGGESAGNLNAQRRQVVDHFS